MKQFLNRKNKSALATLTSLCSDLLLVYPDEISKIYNILILEVLIGKPSKGFVKYLEVAIARLLSGIDADNLRFVRDASSVYLITKLVESVFKRYSEHTRYKYPLELLHFDVITSGKYNMADSFSDFLINKDPHRKDTDICLFIALSESYFSFVKQRNRRFKLARNMVKTNDVGTILAVLCPEDPEPAQGAAEPSFCGRFSLPAAPDGVLYGHSSFFHRRVDLHLLVLYQCFSAEEGTGCHCNDADPDPGRTVYLQLCLRSVYGLGCQRLQRNGQTENFCFFPGNFC